MQIIQTFPEQDTELSNWNLSSCCQAQGNGQVVSLKGNMVSILSVAQLMAARVWQVSASSPGEFRMDFCCKMGPWFQLRIGMQRSISTVPVKIVSLFSIFFEGKISQNALGEGIIYFV